MSTSRTGGRIGTWVAAVVLFGGLAVVGLFSWEGWDGRRPGVTGPRLVAEGTTGNATWSVVHVRERTWGDCLYLRQDGVTVERTCATSGVLQNYELSVRTLRGATAPVLFGMLPAEAARAEVAADGGAVRSPFRTADLVPLDLRAFGGNGRFVAQPAPSGGEWAARNAVPVGVHDAQDRALTPRDKLTR